MNIQKANADDLNAIVQLLADDSLGAQREDDSPPVNASYLKAWDMLSENPYSEIFVVKEGLRLLGLHR